MKKDKDGAYVLLKKDLPKLGIIALMIHNEEPIENIEDELKFKTQAEFDQFFEFTCELIVEDAESLERIRKNYYAIHPKGESEHKA